MKHFFTILIFMSFAIYSRTISLNSQKTDYPIVVSEDENGIAVVSLSLDKLNINDINAEGSVYQYIGLHGFGHFHDLGSPRVPYRAISLATKETPNIKITIIEAEVIILKNFQLHPCLELQVGVAGVDDKPVPFRKNQSLYSTNQFYPEQPFRVLETQTLMGIPLTRIALLPVLHNPVTKELKVYKKLKLKISYSDVTNNRLSNLHGNSFKLIKNSVINKKTLLDYARRNSMNNYGGSSLIITHSKYQDAAEKLAEWQRMKGFEVAVESKSSWSTTNVKSTIRDKYNNSNNKLGYFILLGDNNDIPAEKKSNVLTDNYYASMDSDYKPEVARGRMSVSTSTEAMRFVDKIIQYEKNPTDDADFYKNALACGEYSDREGDIGYADRRFAQTIEDIKLHLDTLGYDNERVYYARSNVTPKFWNRGSYSWGEPIPNYLKKPGFAWDGNGNDVVKAVNKGVFLIYQYDHGMEKGWGAPSFTNTHLNSIKNGNKLPILYSINCLTGKFNTNGECFCEKFTRMEGGVVGIYGATTLSYSGPNEAILEGLIDAVWPELILKTPNTKNPKVKEHDKIFVMGDIINQGMIRMTETWSSSHEAHYRMYHWFGDPTMRIWTMKPRDITVSHTDKIGISSTTFDLNDLNINEGYATLYNISEKKIIGKVIISGATATIDITSPMTDGKAILTITSQDYRPFVIELEVGKTAISSSISPNTVPSISVVGSKLNITLPENQNSRITLSNVKGRMVGEWNSSNLNTSTMKSIDLKDLNINSGMYFVKYYAGDKIFQKQVTFMK